MTLLARFRMTTAKVALLIPGRADALARAELLPAVESATLLLHRVVTEKTPVGATNVARGSIQPSVETVRGRITTIQGTVMSAAPYIVALEKGSRPHWIPTLAPLVRWAKSKGKGEDFAEAVRWKIYHEGTKGAHMFRDAHAETKGKIERTLAQAVERWRQRIGRP